jgi:hypothetical protein
MQDSVSQEIVVESDYTEGDPELRYKEGRILQSKFLSGIAHAPPYTKTPNRTRGVQDNEISPSDSEVEMMSK